MVWPMRSSIRLKFRARRNTSNWLLTGTPISSSEYGKLPTRPSGSALQRWSVWRAWTPRGTFMAWGNGHKEASAMDDLERCEETLREVESKLQGDISSLPSTESIERKHMSEALGFIAKAIVAVSSARNEIAALPAYEVRYRTPNEV